MEKTKEQLELEHSKAMNEAAVERIKEEAKNSITEKSEAVWFEYGKTVEFLDGKVYEIKPVKLGKAKRLMKLLGSFSIDLIILNFLDTGNPEKDEQRINNFFEALMLALDNHPDITREYLDENCDIAIAQYIIETAIGLNRLQVGKK